MATSRAGQAREDAGYDDASVAGRFAGTRCPHPLRTHQAEALDRIEEEMVAGDRQRAWVELPPGSGKTLVGLETIRRLGAPAVVFGPNTAIQSQWVEQWNAYRPATIVAGTDRSLSTPLTALTYQSLATFDPDAEVDEEGHEHLTRPGGRKRGGLLDRLHPHGRALVDTLHATERLTIVLDECHHLLEVWGRLISELLDLVPHAHVLGLTATPPQSLTPAQARLVDELFGHPLYGTSIPAVVREGHLAPFAELAWLTTPTPIEHAWLAGEAERFGELTSDLADPSFGTTPFLTWLDRRFVERRTDTGEAALSWQRLELDDPELTAAALRLHHVDLLQLPEGARLREEHRHPPSAEDWVRLLQDWLRGCLLASTDPADAEVLERIRRALPSVGYQLTKRGIRTGRSPVDRVLARSAAKTHAAVEIAAAEHASLGDRLRLLVLCDHERAAATLPATLHGVLSAEAGSARLMLESLLRDPRTEPLAPMLVTGRTVAAGVRSAEAFRAYAAERRPRLALELGEPDDAGVIEISGRWSSRTWVPLVTDFFESGGCRVLVGTRGLLGEGWDARGVTGMVDLTTATTPTAVVQTRGRALRTDPNWPEKVALNWTVVCVAEEHPKGTADWDRFVRKHQGYLGVDDTGTVVDGVAHVDAAFSPYAPPEREEFDRTNAAMLVRAEDRTAIRERWRIGSAYDDQLVHTLRVRPARVATPDRPSAGAMALPEPPAAVPGPDGIASSTELAWPPLRPLLLRAGVPVAAVLVAAVVAGLVGAGLVAAVLALVGLVGAGVAGEVARRRRRDAARRAGELVAEASRRVDPLRIACAVADGLLAVQLAPVGATAVRAEAGPDGDYRIRLAGVSAEVSERFATALDEAVSPLAAPRYVIPRHLVAAPSGPGETVRAGRSALDGALVPAETVWHAVPTELGTNATRAHAYAAAWRTWVSAGEPVHTGNAQGEGILVGYRGVDPLEVTTVLRMSWE